MQGIYRIYNRSAERSYVGSSIDIEKRLRQHKSALKRGSHANYLLQDAWDKYGESCFVFEAIKEVENAGLLLAHEQIYLDNGFGGKQLYNLLKKAKGSWNKGLPRSDECKEKLSMAQTKWLQTHKHQWEGRRHTQENKDRARIRTTQYYVTHKHPRKGVTNTKEHNRKAGESLLRHYETHDAWNKGLSGHVSEEGRQAMSRARAKPYPAFYNDITREYIPAGNNLKGLCRQKGLPYESMQLLRKGRTKRTRSGWSIAHSMTEESGEIY